MKDELAVERQLEREARETFLGRLGDTAGVNVAKVEVSWWTEHDVLDVEQHAGFFLVHATGDEPQCQCEEGTIYAVFEDLVAAAMNARKGRDGFDGWQTDDISAA